MGFVSWAAAHWGDLLQTVGITSGLFFTAHATYRDAQARKLQTLAELTKGHREIWSALYTKPELARVLSPDADVEAAPPTADEVQHVKFLVLHLAVSHQAARNGLLSATERMERDVREFFSLPIPSTVWVSLRDYQDRAFVRFVESTLVK